MNIYTLDAETFFSKDYSLSKLSTESYIRNPQFEVHGWAVRHPDGATRWYSHPEAVQFFGTVDWPRVAVLGHHLQFDAFILSHWYNVHPGALLDTLSMARLLLGTHVSHSLDGIRQQLGLPAKRTPYDLFKGKRWRELSPEVREAVAAGACDEAQSIWVIFNRFMTGNY